MPELPEVEIVRRELEARLVGGTITRMECADRRIARKPLEPALGSTIHSVERHGKWIRMSLGERRLFAHLGMTGDWAFRSPTDAPLPFERARIDVRRNGRDISARYADARRFGRLIASEGDIVQWSELGPDPLHDGIDVGALRHRIRRRRGAIKVALMDQTVLAGVGNILAIEALWIAKLDPRARVHRIKEARMRTLVRSLRSIIERTLAYDLKMANGEERVRSPFRIYGKETCPRCKDKLRRIELGGRSTTFCRTCQKRS